MRTLKVPQLKKGDYWDGQNKRERALPNRDREVVGIKCKWNKLSELMMLKKHS